MEGMREFLRFRDEQSASSEAVVLREIPSNMILQDVVFGDRDSHVFLHDDGNVENADSHLSQQMHWTRAQTLRLIDAYKSVKIKMNNRMMTKKKMWGLMAEIVEIHPNHCENRWKVLERNYKAFVDNKRETGRGRKPFEYAEEMQAILGRKRSINPSLLLNSDTVNTPQLPPEPIEQGMSDTVERSSPSQQVISTSRFQEEEEQTPVIPRKRTRARYNVLDEIRKDKRRYQERMLKIQEAKVFALQERNRILQEKQLCCCNRKENVGEHPSPII